MRLIAHRANINGSNSEFENNPIQIDICIERGYDVEVDLRIDQDTGHLWLGHDFPQYMVTWDWIDNRCNNLWIHCKDIITLYKFSVFGNKYNYFWHQNDDFTLTSKNYIWTYPGKSFTSNSIIVCPEWSEPDWHSLKNAECYGICTDFVEKLK